MAHSIDGTRSTEPDAGSMISRRRPGRRDDVHPALIPLLRGTVTPDSDDGPGIIADAPMAAESMDLEKDGLAPARGIIFGLVLSVPIWAVLVLGALRLFD
jgi:hypothetical protein